MNTLKVNRARLVRRFLRLVKIDSLSREEGRLVKYLKKQLSALGIRPHEDDAGWEIDGEAGNIIARLKGNVKRSPTLLLNAHLDTVMPGKGIRPRLKKGIIKTDGTTVLGADNKAGIAVILEFVRMLKENRIPHPELRLIFTVAEEIGLLGSKSLRKKFLKADLGYTMDGGQVETIIYKAPSQSNIEAEIIGRAAHAGVHPEEGINAIKVASVAIAQMKLGRIDSETTANIGIIKGGLATNIIPERVELKGEARSNDLKKLKKQITHMEEKLWSACGKFKARLKVKVESAYRSFNIDKKEKVVALALKAAKKIGLKPALKATGGGSDANIFNAFGIPTVILGVGAERVHTTQEFIAVDSMVKAVRYLLAIVEDA